MPPARSSSALLTVRITVGVLAAALLAAPVVPVAAQSAGSNASISADTPEAATTGFLRSVRAIQWERTAAYLHPDTRQRFRETVQMIVDADTTGAMLAFLTTDDGATALDDSNERVFNDAIGAVIDDMPGLMHALYDRDDDVVGAVTEGADDAHVVYRTLARISGAQPEVEVMQLRRTAAGWRILWSDELDVLDAALRGIARRPPPPR